ncbi:hypothetical protein GGI05_004418 [Coemansia sp. RSA 2603]|nr:hypothetical protein GGI05_004418 [Coemansia sp. RSA 2603]
MSQQHNKKRRKNNDEDPTQIRTSSLQAVDYSQEDDKTLHALHPYSQSSLAVQSRRRAKVLDTIREQAGGDGKVSEQVHLLRDSFLRTKDDNAQALYDGLIESSALTQVMENIRLMYESLPADRRSGILSLVAQVFGESELQNRWGLSFGKHQLQTARQLAKEKRFPIEPHSRALPPSRRPKNERVREAVEKLLTANAYSPLDNSDSNSKCVLKSSLRALHKQYLDEHVNDPAMKLSFSTFRALSLNKFCLPDQIPARVASSVTAPAVDSLVLPTSTHMYRSIRPLVSSDASASAAANIASTPLAAGALATEPFAQVLDSIMDTEISTLFRQQPPVNPPNSTTNSQMIPGLDLSVLGIDTLSRSDQQLPLTLPPLDIPSISLFNSGTSHAGQSQNYGPLSIDSRDLFAPMPSTSAALGIPNISSFFNMQPQDSIQPSVPESRMLISEIISGTQPTGRNEDDNNDDESAANALSSEFFYF